MTDLGEVLKKACTDGWTMDDLTVLANQNDPFRLDTPANHTVGVWLATKVTQHLGRRTIHLRGLHYVLVSALVVKPNGKPYTNTESDWTWLQGKSAKAARWLGYVRFEQITDAKNTPPIVRRFSEPRPTPVIDVGVQIRIPSVADLTPEVDVDDFEGVQPYKLVFFGEKTSLDDVLAPVAEEYGADLYLPSGEISDTMLHNMAAVGDADGRPMVVFVFADCDPAGWQMAISIGRKLQALKALRFPDLDFRVQRVGLLPEHVREYGLPSTPLKETERRVDRWQAEKGVQQTEIDALATPLQPQLLRRLAVEAVRPYYDETLDDRVWNARNEWLTEAQQALGDQLDQDALERLRVEASERLAQLREEVDAINRALRVATDQDFELPDIVVPLAELEGEQLREVINSNWSFVEQTRRLIADKAYAGGDE